jgi:hypothetical protein
MPQTRFSKFDFKVTHASSRCPAHFLLQFWSDIEELDKHAWVLEPESPNLADIHRRIVVAKHAYLDITIKCDPFRSTSFTPLNQYLCSDAAHPRAAPPTLALVGAEATCAPLRQHIRNYRWSSDKSLLDNILLSLSLATLPSPPRAVGLSAVEDEGLVALECGICYAYRMEVPFIQFPVLYSRSSMSQC